MEPINSPLLNLVEAFGTRNQEQYLGDQVVPTWNVASDAFVNMRLVGADTGIGALPAGTVNILAITVQDDLYLTGIWLIEPTATVDDQCVFVDGFLQRATGVGAPQQYCPLQMAGGRFALGTSTPQARMHVIEGPPYGTLVRAGDLISTRIFNRQAVATTAGMTIAYRGFKGPPA